MVGIFLSEKLDKKIYKILKEGIAMERGGSREKRSILGKLMNSSNNLLVIQLYKANPQIPRWTELLACWDLRVLRIYCS